MVYSVLGAAPASEAELRQEEPSLFPLSFFTTTMTLYGVQISVRLKVST